MLYMIFQYGCNLPWHFLAGKEGMGLRGGMREIIILARYRVHLFIWDENESIDRLYKIEHTHTDVELDLCCKDLVAASVRKMEPGPTLYLSAVSIFSLCLFEKIASSVHFFHQFNLLFWCFLVISTYGLGDLLYIVR